MGNESGEVVIEVFGEGKTDVGAGAKPERPERGVLPILVHRLCGSPENMLVKVKGFAFLEKGKTKAKSLSRKVEFARRQAFYNGSAGAAFVLDAEGGDAERKERLAEIAGGRDRCQASLPMAVGVAQPCIEAWLLADAKAIRKGLDLTADPPVPDKPEEVPAPCQDRKTNAKTILAGCNKVSRGELSADEKDRIARSIKDLNRLRERCPLGFVPFADEVQRHLRPLFREQGENPTR